MAIDTGNMFIHVMNAETRAAIDLETLWSSPPVLHAHHLVALFIPLLGPDAKPKFRRGVGRVHGGALREVPTAAGL